MSRKRLPSLRLGYFLSLTAMVGFASLLALEWLHHGSEARRSEEKARSLGSRLDEILTGGAGFEWNRRDPPVSVEGFRRRWNLVSESRSTFGNVSYLESELARQGSAVEEGPAGIQPPVEVGAVVSLDGVQVVWRPNPRNAGIAVGYRVYRWQRGSHPRLLTPEPLEGPPLHDPDVGSEETYYYCVVAVAEDEKDGVPVLRQSGQGRIVEVSTRQTQRIHFLGLADGGVAGRFRIEIYRDGTWQSREILCRPGEAVCDPPDRDGGFRTPWSLEQLVVEAEEVLEEVRHPAFNDDGSRRLDPETGEPAFVVETVSRLVDVPRAELKHGRDGRRLVLKPLSM